MINSEIFKSPSRSTLRAERKIEQICRSFDMDCVDLNHEACWSGRKGVMPCCGVEVEFEKEKGICPFLWLRDEA